MPATVQNADPKWDADKAKGFASDWDKSLKQLTGFLSQLDKAMSDGLKKMQAKDGKAQDDGSKVVGGLQPSFKTAAGLLKDLSDLQQGALKQLKG